MAETFTREELWALDPCYPYNLMIDRFPEEEATAHQIMDFIITQGAPFVLSWLMAGSVKLATAFLTEEGQDVNIAGPSGMTALHFAAKHERPDVITYLRSQGGDREIENDEGLTPRDVANLTGNPDVIAAMEA